MEKKKIITITLKKNDKIEDVVDRMFFVSKRTGYVVDCIYNDVYLTTCGFYNKIELIDSYNKTISNRLIKVRSNRDIYASKKVMQLTDSFREIDFTNGDEIVQWINEISKYSNYVEKPFLEFSTVILGVNGYRNWKSMNNSYILERYNTAEQFVKLCSDKDIVSRFIIGKYIGSIDTFSSIKEHVHYYSRIYCDRFVKEVQDNKVKKK